MTVPLPWRLPLVLGTGVGAVGLAAWPGELGFWRALGVASGWVGVTLALASLLLLFRHPALARAAGGLERMLRLHHLCGLGAYGALLLHPLALAAESGTGWALLDPLTQGWPERWGWVSLLLMMVGLMAGAWPAMPYRRWRRLHHLLSLSVLAGLAHLALLRADTVVPWGVAALAAAGLVVRYAVVDRGGLSLPYRVKLVHPQAPDVVEATLQPLAAALSVQPGQFVLLALGSGPGFAGCGEFHPFTVSRCGPGGELQVAIKSLGPCSARAQRLTEGTAVRVQGPFGQFLAERDGRPQLWVAGGIGVTPFVAALRDGPLARPTALLDLSTDPGRAPFAEELRHMADAQPLLQWLPCASRDATRDLPHLLDRVSDLPSRQVFACGPEPMVRALQHALTDRGLPPQAVHAERFDFR